MSPRGSPTNHIGTSCKISLRIRTTMLPPTLPGRRKIDRSSRPEYQKLIDGDSIYTCTNFTSEREGKTGESGGQRNTSTTSTSKKFRRSVMVIHGPWFLDLLPVLERRDQDRLRLWKRQRNKSLKRLANAHPPLPHSNNPDITITPALLPIQPPTVPPVDPIPAAANRLPPHSQDPLHRPDTSISSAPPTIQDLSVPPAGNPPSRGGTPEKRRALFLLINGAAIFFRWGQDLLRTIHHEAVRLYSAHDVLNIPTPHRGPRPKNWEEPIAMARALDGSALMAIGVLLEEITKDQIESGLLSDVRTASLA
ncbi:hypothetical protein VP01_1965g2 [Puccinia sorghi]|uniref:Uncharacterized protein n=1 Tax=Puccinia sorghi TaxID=27349 RepID=A0A0L6VBY7_9BASI|nr:hypothetical protein VP01_1965g2 [Puccinia sorghi]